MVTAHWSGGTLAYEALILAITAQRLAEMHLSRRNAAWCLEHGGVEYGRWQLPLIVVAHTGLLIGCAVEPVVTGRPFLPWSLPLLGVLGGAQAVRLMTMRALGKRWTAKVIVIPGLPRISSGPYRFLRHPNYVAVVAEGLALPLIGSAWLTALLFTALNTPLLAVRIRTEDAVLDAGPSDVPEPAAG